MKQSSFRLLLILGVCGLVGGALTAQHPAPPAAPVRVVNASTDPMLQGFKFRSIGPAVMMGRIDDIEGAEKDPMIMYIGFATGGVWKSTDGGNHWLSLFDEMPVTSIGDIAIAPSDPNVVYVGTGEPNNRQSSSIGGGVYKTTDGGKTWADMGLEDTQSIGRIVVNPTVLDRLRTQDEKHLIEMEKRYFGKLSFRADPAMHAEQFKIQNVTTNEELANVGS